MHTDLPTLPIAASWADLLDGAGRAAIEALLPGYIHPRRWFGAKARQIESATIVEAIPLADAYLTMARLACAGGGQDTYVLPLAIAGEAAAARLLAAAPHAVLARLGDGGALCDAAFDPAFCAALLETIETGRKIRGAAGELQATPTSAFGRLRGDRAQPLEPQVGTAEQSNTSIIYGGQLIMKLFRKLEPGLNPDLEIGRFLTERGFRNTPPTAGAIEYRAGGEPAGLAFLQGFVANQGDAWSFTLRAIAGSLERVLAAQPGGAAQLEGELFAGYRDAAGLLGRRTAEMHLALFGGAHDPAFAPEPFDEGYRQAVYASMCARAERALQALRGRLDQLEEPVRAGGRRILDLEGQILDRIRAALGRPIDALRARIHGDYHLGQVLATGTDFYIIDFEGEPARPLAERRVKSSPLQDVAGMLRSLHYAPYAVLFGQAPGVAFRDEEIPPLEPWARLWHRSASAAFMAGYLAAAGQAPFVPGAAGEMQALLDVYLLDKAVYELAYELNNRPAWVRIPIEGILQLLT